MSKLPILALCALSISSTVIADEMNVKKSQEEQKPDERTLYKPIGVRLGSFVILPSFESKNEWNDNIFSTQERETSDFIFHIKPALKIKSDWNNHALNLSVGSDIAFYNKNSAENKEDYYVTLDGRLDVLRNSFATAKLYYKNTKEDRGSPEAIASLSTEPLETEVLGATLGYEHKINRVRINVSHDIQHSDHKNGRDPFSNVVENSQRTRYKNTSEARLGYELSSGYEAYIKGSYNFIDYENVFTAQNNLDRSSQGYNIAAGITVDITHTLAGDAYIGYRNQDYDSPALTSISGVSGGLDLTWLPTRLTTVKVGVDRKINETTQVGLSGFFSTAFSASVEHKLMRNILLNFHTSYTDNDYKGTNAINRQEDVYNAGFYLKYLLNRNFYLKTGYDYKGRATNLDGSDYDINNIYFTIGAQL